MGETAAAPAAAVLRASAARAFFSDAVLSHGPASDTWMRVWISGLRFGVLGFRVWVLRV